MSIIATAPERLALMLVDCDSRIKGAYHFVQDNIDELKRPCFIINTGEETYEYAQAEQTFIADANFQIDFVGMPFTSHDAEYNHVHEIQAREIAANAILYFIRRPQMQFTNTLGKAAGQLPVLDGVMYARAENRSSITLKTREGITDPYFGFEISFIVRATFTESEDEALVVYDDEDDSGL